MIKQSAKWTGVIAAVLGLHASVFALSFIPEHELQASEEQAGGIAIDLLEELTITDTSCPIATQEIEKEVTAADEVLEAQLPREQAEPKHSEALMEPQSLAPETATQQRQAQDELKQQLEQIQREQAQAELKAEQQRQLARQRKAAKQQNLAAARARKAALAKKIVSEAIPGNNARHVPHYPRTLRRRGIEGTVVLQVSVDKAGKVTELRLKQSSGHKHFDQSALKAIKHWSYTPAKNGLGQRIASTKVERIVYRLQ
ncbi:energy transducer TonB [Rubritalea marina]|uniref:energy transducer TonB n=1 Tax=Rubritalea marina TaxID=361055 RepID=UPI0003746E57|nr:energy transducer TonB [Rubritalea marina]